MNELELMRAHISAASTSADRETALAYITYARSQARKIAAELRITKVTLDAIEKDRLRIQAGGQAPLIPEEA